MNIYIANSRIFEIEGEINDLLNKKEEELCNVLPKSSNFEKEKIFSSRVDNNKNLYFIIENEKIDKQIDYLYKEKNILLNFIEKELIRLDKYKEVKSIIIHYVLCRKKTSIPFKTQYLHHIALNLKNRSMIL